MNGLAPVGVAVGGVLEEREGAVVGERGHADVAAKFELLRVVFLCACRADCQHAGQHCDYFFHCFPFPLIVYVILN